MIVNRFAPFNFYHRTKITLDDNNILENFINRRCFTNCHGTTAYHAELHIYIEQLKFDDDKIRLIWKYRRNGNGDADYDVKNATKERV